MFWQIGAATRVRDSCAFSTHKFFNERGFLYIHTPLITASDCEGAGEMFQVTTMIPDNPKGDLPRKKDGSIDYDADFFKAKANLTVSGQLQVECFAVSMCDVYTFGPTFRAEKSDTYRHLAEFWMIEPEIWSGLIRVSILCGGLPSPCSYAFVVFGCLAASRTLLTT